MLSVDEFAKATQSTPAAAAKWTPHINKAMEEFGIDTRKRQAGFLAQMAVESGNFTNFVESLNYSVEGLAATWPKRFATNGVPNALARKLGRSPSQPADQQGIANLCYGGRFGNDRPGDGWLYRGRAPKQITFHDNYRDCGIALGLPLLTEPELLLVPANGARSAAWYWHSRNINALIDVDNWVQVSRTVNGGDNGLKKRIAMHGWTNQVLRVA